MSTHNKMNVLLKKVPFPSHTHTYVVDVDFSLQYGSCIIGQLKRREIAAKSKFWCESSILAGRAVDFVEVFS